MNAATKDRSSRRGVITIAALAIAAAVTLCLPWPIRIERPALLQPIDAQVIRAEVPGRIQSIQVRTGQTVRAGDLIATLSNERLTSDIRVAEWRLAGAKKEEQLTLGADYPSAYRQAQSTLAQAETALKEAQRLASRLELRAARGGVVLTPDLERLLAGSLRAGDALCEIASIDPIHLYIPLGERQARHIRVGQRVQLRVSAESDFTFEGKVLEDKKTPPARELPANLVATLGGDIAAAPNAQNQLVPIETTYGITVELANPSLILHPGMTGTALIHGDTMPLARVLWVKLLDFISLDYRL